MSRSITLPALALIGLMGMMSAACGDASQEDAARTGKTDCGRFGGQAVSCEAGQYCADQVLNECAQGCTSDRNCDAAQVCVKASGQNVGVCQRSGATPTPTPTPTPEPEPEPKPTTTQARCEAAVDKARGCGALSAQEVAAVKAACADSSADGTLLAKALADCVEAAKVCGAELNTCLRGDQGPGDGPTCEQRGAGFTTCGGEDGLTSCCQPGQYCEDALFGECELGCLSDANCAANQRCALGGGSPGRCL